MLLIALTEALRPIGQQFIKRNRRIILAFQRIKEESVANAVENSWIVRK